MKGLKRFMYDGIIKGHIDILLYIGKRGKKRYIRKEQIKRAGKCLVRDITYSSLTITFSFKAGLHFSTNCLIPKHCIIEGVDADAFINPTIPS